MTNAQLIEKALESLKQFNRNTDDEAIILIGITDDPKDDRQTDTVLFFAGKGQSLINAVMIACEDDREFRNLLIASLNHLV